jgi:hypothetical protein
VLLDDDVKVVGNGNEREGMDTMAERDVRERDILVASNEFAYVQDLTKGDIVLYVGPTKISLSNTERLVELRNDRFVPVRGEDGSVGVSPFVSASSAQYIILENPPREAGAKPVKGNNSSIDLLAGRKVVVSGPATFPLWPGQKAKVIGGHELREDEYLVARVYDAVAGAGDVPIGTERIIKGSETSFYVPPTGIEVVPTDKGYVRKARRLRKNSGLHVRVVKAFVAAEGDQLPVGSYAAGQDVFLEDREGFFFPTETLEVVGEVSAVPIAEKEGIYVRELESGKITTVVGPVNYLPDPTRVEVVDRFLDEATAILYGIKEHDPSRALSIYIPPSSAVLVTAKNKREVVKGPQTRILNFDEDLEVLRLSTGRPKNDEALLPTCFLQTEGNKVSDVVRVKTADHVELEVALSYRVSFATKGGEAERWFNVKNYVGLLCDHLGSILRAAARATSIEQFHAHSTEVLRAAILGDKKGEEKRAGRMFDENGMWVYDVEVLDVRILDADVKKLLSDAQRTAIVSEVNRKQEELRLGNEKLKEEVNRQIYEAQILTLVKGVELEGAKREIAMARVTSTVDLDKREKVGRATNEAEALGISSTASATVAEREWELARKAIEAKVAAFAQQMQAMSPELITTLKVLGNQHLAAELSKNVSPLAILGGESVADVVERLLGSLPLGSGDAALRSVLPLKPRPSKEG